MRKYLHVAVALAVCLAFALASAHVSAASRASASTTPPKLKAGVTLSVWDYFCKTGQTTCPERDTEWSVIKQWEKISKDKVNFPTNPDSHDNKMCTAGPAKQGPDLVSGPHNEMGAMVACQTLAPVRPGHGLRPTRKSTSRRLFSQPRSTGSRTRCRGQLRPPASSTTRPS